MPPKLLRDEQIIPPADVVETPEEILVSIDLPGISVEQVMVSMDGRMLEIEANSDEPSSDTVNILLQEREIGPIKRVFKLPTSAAGGEIDVSSRDGVLSLRIKKQFSSSAVHIPIITTSDSSKSS